MTIFSFVTNFLLTSPFRKWGSLRQHFQTILDKDIWHGVLGPKKEWDKLECLLIPNFLIFYATLISHLFQSTMALFFNTFFSVGKGTAKTKTFLVETADKGGQNASSKNASSMQEYRTFNL